MNKTITFILILFSFQSHCQRIENENLKFYKRVTFDMINGWKIVGEIKNGKIISQTNYLKRQRRGKSVFLENKIANENIEILYSANEKIGDTLDYISRQIEETDLCKKIYKSGVVEIHSKFNSKKMPELIERVGNRLDSLSGFRKETKYDDCDNIILERNFYKLDNIIHENTNEYIRDLQNNVIEINRKSNPQEDYPIIMTGGFSQYENEKFEYIYNSKNLWTKKYWIVNGEKKLIEKRKYK